MKKAVFNWCNINNIEIDIEKCHDDKRKYNCITLYAPNNYCFEKDLHLRNFPDLLYYDINKVWEYIFIDVCQNELIKCNNNCNCKE